MILAKSIQSLWANPKHRAEILRLYNLELTQRFKAHNLVHRYTDTNGQAYFAYPKDMGQPVERLGKLFQYTELLFKGLSASEDEAIDNAIMSHIEAGLNNSKKKGSASIAVLIGEKKRRRGIILHHELIYNILAVQWIREDEEPTVFNNEIQKQKVEQFQKESEAGAGHPFFQAPELKQLNSFLEMSKEEWMQSLNESKVQAEVLKESLKILSSSDEESVTSKKILTAV